MSKPLFQDVHTLNERINMYRQISQKYPSHVLVILQKSPNSYLSSIAKTKYLVPKDFILGKFLQEILGELMLKSYQNIFLFVGNCLPDISATMESIYLDYHDSDGFLYMYYCEENIVHRCIIL